MLKVLAPHGNMSTGQLHPEKEDPNLTSAVPPTTAVLPETAITAAGQPRLVLDEKIVPDAPEALVEQVVEANPEIPPVKAPAVVATRYRSGPNLTSALKPHISPNKVLLVVIYAIVLRFLHRPAYDPHYSELFFAHPQTSLELGIPSTNTSTYNLHGSATASIRYPFSKHATHDFTSIAADSHIAELNLNFFLTEVLLPCFFVWKAVVRDIIMIHINLVSWKSLGILAATTVLHKLAARYLDLQLASYFYSKVTHENLHQFLPEWTLPIAKKGFKYLRNFSYATVLWPIQSFWIRESHLILILTGYWLSLCKRTLKLVVDNQRWENALRPPNADFLRGVYYGGFPSGHVAQCIVGLAMSWLSFGLYHPFTLILMVQTLLVCVWVIVSNRHYASQVVGGVCMGLLYSVAAHEYLLSMHL